MKKIGIVLIITVLFATSCTDYLQEDNRSTITTDEFYATQGGYEALVNASYSTLRELYTDMNVDADNQKNFCSFQALSLLGTDLFCTAKLADQNDILDGYFLLTPDHWAPEKMFSNCYKAIQLHNVALDWADRTAQYEALPTRVAEVRFIRAYMYHILVETFGGVSIVTEAFDKPVLSFERDSEEDVYSFIITELEDILASLPVRAEAPGRVTKGAAEHLLAAVYLSRGYTSFAGADDFQKAAQYATNVIESEAGYELLPDFESVFEVGNEINSEIVFSIQFDKNSLINGIGGNNWASWGGLYAAATPGWPYRSGQIRPTDRAYLQYNLNDKRYEASFMTNKYNPYYDFYDEGKSEDDKTITQVYPHPSIELDTINPQPETWVFLADYTVFVPASEEWEDTDYPWVRKFDDPASVTQYDNTKDIFLFRLAETYLIRAEANIQRGLSGDDDIYAVRARSWDLMPVNADIDTILDERGREFMGEGKRWYDLRRTGKLIERVSEHNPSVLRYINLGNNPFGTNNGKALRRPIPTDVIQRDLGAYGQNEGY
ncbi:MAG: RagB/SusD family nutrient uptake outer membrane protein [Bacteroidales bacterium]|nr:RagB/SusD family nutrient uptake outer membrane protein [Bacteroidales bacterium]MCF8391534.1 RagB/SusD family nutrient uptake outer membrane protein [Bacteroidales bacterium]